MVPKLHYFALPARAECARLMFSIGGKEFEDKRFGFAEWRTGDELKDLKAAIPFGQLPVLEVEEGKYLAQSAAIVHYVAQLTGLLPEDPWAAALADQAFFFCEDLWQTVQPTLRIQESEKVKARQDLLKGALGDKLKLLSKLVEARPGRFLTGDKLTHGDVQVFCVLSTLQSGWLDGLPTDLLDSYPALKEFRESIATVPEVAAFYSKEDDDIRSKGFRARA